MSISPDKDELIPATSTSSDNKPEEDKSTSDEKAKVPEKESKEQQSKFSALPNLYSRFVQSFENALDQIINEPASKAKLESLDLDGVVNYVKTKNVRNIVFMVGAGISTSAGVPDFRSPGSGLYDNLQKYNLPDPQAIFEINFFEKNPEPFYALCREIFPESLKPTPLHYLMRLLDEKGYLRRTFSQNIDCLENISGLQTSRIVAAHGSYQSSTCLKCKKKYTMEWLLGFLRQSEVLVPKCQCSGIIKPDIVFFGESLPSRFFTSAINDFPKCDLLIIVGTSLVVQPFASMIHEVSDETPRLVVNLEPVGKVSKKERARGAQGLEYDETNNVRDVFWKGAADDFAWQFAELLNMKDELGLMINAGWKKIDDKIKHNVSTLEDLQKEEKNKSS